MEKSVAEKEKPSFETVWAAIQELAEERRKTEKVVRRTSRQMGDLHNKFGKLAEHLVIPRIHTRFNELGHHFKGVLPGGVKIYDDAGKVKTQVDIMLENADTVVAIEIKVQVNLKDIEHHLKRMEILHDYRRKANDNRKIQGAIAGAIFGETEKRATIEAGFYVIEQSGDTMIIDIPSDFVPREW
jgi:predicted AAA+ superfamily ATPase